MSAETLAAWQARQAFEAEQRRIIRGAMPLVFTTRPACPSCGSTDRKIDRTCPRESDGSQTRYCSCQTCGERFKHVEENPE